MNFYKAIKQFSLNQKIILSIGLLCEKIIDKLPNYYLIKSTSKTYKEIISKGYKIKKHNTCNIIKYNNYKILIRRISSDITVFKQIFIDNEYESVVNLAKKKIIDHDQIILIDAGANIGLATLYFNQNFKNMRSILIEPDEGNFNILRENLSINNITNCCSIKKALWPIDENLQIINTFRDRRNWALRVEKYSNNNVEPISAITITDLIHDFNLDKIDILKIDIEGAEKVLFEHTTISELLRLTKIIVIEIHEEMSNKEHIISILENHSFDILSSNEFTIGVSHSLRVM